MEPKCIRAAFARGAGDVTDIINRYMRMKRLTPLKARGRLRPSIETG